MRLRCPGCGQPIEAPGEQAGAVITCACGQKMRVPSAPPATAPPSPPPPVPAKPVAKGNPFADLNDEGVEIAAAPRRRFRADLPAGTPQPLGGLVAAFAPPYRIGDTILAPLALVFGLATMMVVCAGASVLRADPRFLAGMAVAGVSLLAYGGRLLYRSLRGLGRRVYVCEHGLYDVGLAVRRAVLWEEISDVHQMSEQTLNRKARRVEVLTHSGACLVYTDAIEGVVALSNLIQDGVVRDRLPPALGTLRAGRPVHFGPLSVTREGIECDRHFLRWDDVDSVDVTRDLVLIRKRHGRGAWAEVALAEVPNVRVFEKLVAAQREARGLSV